MLFAPAAIADEDARASKRALWETPRTAFGAKRYAIRPNKTVLRSYAPARCMCGA